MLQVPFVANVIIVVASTFNNLIPVALFVTGLQFFVEFALIGFFKPMESPTDNFTELFVRMWKMVIVMAFMYSTTHSTVTAQQLD